MSVDPSLKIKNALVRHRNVLTRAERIDVLKNEDRWSDEHSVLGLPKVAHRKSGAGKKSKSDLPEGVAAVTDVKAETPTSTGGDA